MIQFKEVRFKNFLYFGDQFLSIPLDEHKTTLILGINGAGKSGILDALSFGLYGKPFRNITKPDLVNSITQKDCLVEVEFVVGSREYLVRRGIKPVVFEIYQNGKLLDQDARSLDYQEMFESSILKLSHKSFNQIVVLGLANFTPFMQLPAAGRRQIIEDLLDIQIFSVMNTLLKDKIAFNKNELQEIDYKLKLTESKIAMHRAHQMELQSNRDVIIKEREAKIKEYEDENGRLQSTIEEDETEMERLKEKVRDEKKVKTKLSKLRLLRDQCAAKIAVVSKELEFYLQSSHCPTCEQEIGEDFKAHKTLAKRERLAELEQALEKLHAECAELDSAVGAFAQINSALTVLNERFLENSIKIATNQQFTETMRNEIANLQERELTETGDDLSFEQEQQSLKSQKERLVQSREVFNMAAQLLKDGGIKTKIVRQYVPIINRLINKFLAALDFFIQFEIDEEFKEKIKSRFRDEFRYESFSQGERMRIDLALMFAWRALAKLRNSSSCNLLIFDEIGDSSLDHDGFEAFNRIVADMLHDTNVFVISHRQDQSFDRYEKVILFQKQKNFSQVVDAA